MTDQQVSQIHQPFTSSLPESQSRRDGRRGRASPAQRVPLSGVAARVAESVSQSGEDDAPPAVDWQPLDLARLWDAVCAGTWKFQEVFDSDLRCYAVLDAVEPAHIQPLPPRSRTILGRLLLGESHKVVAFELRVTPSTVATSAQTGLQTMGLKCYGSRAPMLLGMAACAALYPRRAPIYARSARVNTGERECLLVSMARPDLQFPVQLSPAEAAVLRQLVSGATHADIARSRAVSCRTIANQLANSFRKLGVSGRAALTAQLIRLAPEFRAT